MSNLFTMTTFTPGEAERITGLTTTMQRDWRRRGFLPWTERHARFDGFVLSEMLAQKLLADRGIGPQTSKVAASLCALGMMREALLWPEAWASERPVDDGVTWGSRAESLIQQLISARGLPDLDPGPFFIWWADESVEFAEAIDRAFGGSHTDPKYAGPVILLDLAALATTMLGRAGRPLVQVKAGEAIAKEDLVLSPRRRAASVA